MGVDNPVDNINQPNQKRHAKSAQILSLLFA